VVGVVFFEPGLGWGESGGAAGPPGLFFLRKRGEGARRILVPRRTIPRRTCGRPEYFFFQKMSNFFIKKCQNYEKNETLLGPRSSIRKKKRIDFCRAWGEKRLFAIRPMAKRYFFFDRRWKQKKRFDGRNITRRPFPHRGVVSVPVDGSFFWGGGEKNFLRTRSIRY
jgi:hypothetical protein